MKKLLLALALLCAASTIQAQERLTDKELVNVIYAMGQMFPDGFTLDLNTMRQPTEGLMVSYKETQNSFDRKSLPAVIKHAHAHERLQAQLRDGTLVRTYLAICEGIPEPAEGAVDLPIAREPGSVLRRMVSPDGAPARTHYRVLETGNGSSLLSLKLDTGRTHQIRVHMAYIHHPLLGDSLYGPPAGSTGARRQMLHAGILGFEHPRTGAYMEFEAPLPEDFETVLGKLRRTQR